ncbi:hypothetical protein NBO_28g0029 [Nosema bombycis CQ1]|uniref:Sm domain-containing protein n=1 Tax=Nosema bombycis (strain CQ1 / CVCC 102059) TaxID=578461 RepID=R0MJM3_NOSB1|nr:hypothetical protein NBO_28g0029 [Nosema bombycis CQ1]|eukprot:EOB14390.1 hypothetical protein NBO_28g0029 [Nosema bombycis CQ1]
MKNGLVNFLKKLINESVSVETKDNLTIKGIIIKVDKFSNLYLKDVKIGDSNLEKLNIKGSNIRYIKFREIQKE